jgi:hypothetical protein
MFQANTVGLAKRTALFAALGLSLASFGAGQIRAARRLAPPSTANDCTWNVINTTYGGAGACQCTDVANGCSDGCGAYVQETLIEENSCTGETQQVNAGEVFFCGEGC